MKRRPEEMGDQCPEEMGDQCPPPQARSCPPCGVTQKASPLEAWRLTVHYLREQHISRRVWGARNGSNRGLSGPGGGGWLLAKPPPQSSGAAGMQVGYPCPHPETGPASGACPTVSVTPGTFPGPQYHLAAVSRGEGVGFRRILTLAHGAAKGFLG